MHQRASATSDRERTFSIPTGNSRSGFVWLTHSFVFSIDGPWETEIAALDFAEGLSVEPKHDALYRSS
jgi:hypothetical protein